MKNIHKTGSMFALALLLGACGGGGGGGGDDFAPVVTPQNPVIRSVLASDAGSYQLQGNEQVSVDLQPGVYTLDFISQRNGIAVKWDGTTDCSDQFEYDNKNYRKTCTIPNGGKLSLANQSLRLVEDLDYSITRSAIGAASASSSSTDSGTEQLQGNQYMTIDLQAGVYTLDFTSQPGGLSVKWDGTTDCSDQFEYGNKTYSKTCTIPVGGKLTLANPSYTQVESFDYTASFSPLAGAVQP